MTKTKKALSDLFDRAKTKKQVYDSVVALLRSLGAEVDESRKGSNVVIIMNHKEDENDKSVTNLHRPHPGKELKPYAVKNLRTFLESLGYWPLEEEGPEE